jgi:hypothetical protein
MRLLARPDRTIRITDPADPRIAEFTSMRDRDLAGRGDRFIAEGRVVLQALTDALDDAGPGAATRVSSSRKRCSWKTGWRSGR